MDSGSRVTTRLAVETPESVHIELQLAGPVPRALAFVIDIFVRWAMVLGGFTIVVIVAAILGTTGFDLGLGFWSVMIFFVEWGYPWVFEAYGGGRTPGKRALGLRVVRSNGAPVDPLDALLRNLLRGVDFLPFAYGLGLASMIVGTRFQRLGDLAADTVVIRERERLPVLPPGAFRDLAPLPARAAARARFLSARTRRAITNFLVRRERINYERSDEIGRLLAVPLAEWLHGDEEEHEQARRTPERLLARVLEARGPNVRGGAE